MIHVLKLVKYIIDTMIESIAVMKKCKKSVDYIRSKS